MEIWQDNFWHHIEPRESNLLDTNKLAAMSEISTNNNNNIQLRKKARPRVNFGVYDNEDINAPGPSSLATIEEITSNSSQAVEINPRLWDRFKTIPPPDEDESQNPGWALFMIRMLKFITINFTFCVIVFFALVTKNITTLMASMIKSGHSHRMCSTFNNYDVVPKLNVNSTYMVEYGPSSPERISWVWALYFSLVAPYVFTFMSSIYRTYTQKTKKPKFNSFLAVFIVDSLHILGLAILMFVVLPRHDSMKCLMMMNSTCLVPSFLKLLTNRSKPNEWYNFTIFGRSVWAIINAIFQVLAVVGWTVIGAVENIDNFYMIPIALILASFEWWENYLIIEEEKPKQKWRAFFKDIQTDLNKSRPIVQLFMSLWKVIVLFIVLLANEAFHNKKPALQVMFTKFDELYSDHEVHVLNIDNSTSTHHGYLHVNTPLVPIYLMIVHISFSYLCYFFVKFACKVCIQSKLIDISRESRLILISILQE